MRATLRQEFAMSADHSQSNLPADETEGRRDGGLHAPAEMTGWRKAWWWLAFVVRVNLARLRFIAAIALIGLILTQWDYLVARYEKWMRRAATAKTTSESEFEWFCPMHPSIVRDNPRDKCPICFMPLSKRKKGSGHVEPLPAGVISRVQLSPYRVLLAGIRTWEVSYQPLRKTIRTVGYVAGVHWQALALASLVLIGLWAFHFPKIGVAFMPPLDEGTTLDMPITVPRASVTEAADDLKARDALLRGFPEVESVIGKAGRADTPTDPAPSTWSRRSSIFGQRNFGRNVSCALRTPGGKPRRC